MPGFMQGFSRESAEETYNAMASKEGRKELLRNHLVEFLAPHASHLLSTGVNAIFNGNSKQTQGQGGVASAARDVAGAAKTMLSQGASKISASTDAALGSIADIATTTARDKAASFIHGQNLNPSFFHDQTPTSPDTQSLIPGRTPVGPGSPNLPMMPSTVQNAATSAAAMAKEPMQLSLARARLQVPTPPTRTQVAVPMSTEEDEEE